MADPGRSPSQSRDLIPYATEGREIVLRHKNKLVVYDHQSRQLLLSDARECPYCHRPFDVDTELHPDDGTDNDRSDSAPFATPRYFQLLAASIAPSPSSSRDGSPSRRYPPLPYAGADSSGLRPQLPSTSQGTTPPRTKPTRISTSAFTQGYFDRFFTTEKELGRGGKGTVLLVKHVLDGVDLGKFACKRIPVGNNHSWLEKALMEVSLLQNMSHENLVSYRHVWLEDYQSTAFGPRTPHVFILQQFCDSGTLFEYVLGPNKKNQSTAQRLKEHARRLSMNSPPQSRSAMPLSFDEIFTFFKDTASGLAYLHDHGFVHRDVKPQNCLLHRTDAGLRALLSDFGEMQFANTPRQPAATGYTGTISFSAPEVLRPDASGKLGDFTSKSDVFSLGMIVYFMSFGHLPYANADLEEENEDMTMLKAEIISWAGMQRERRERTDLPEKLYGFLNLLLSPDPADRPSTGTILQAIRAESGYGDFPSTASPLKERFDSPERMDASPPLPAPDPSGLRRRSLRGDPQRHSRSFSRDGLRSRYRSSGETRSPSSPLGIVDEPPNSTDVAVVRSPRLYQQPSAITEEPTKLPLDSPHITRLLPAPPPRQSALARQVRSLMHSPRAMRYVKIAVFLGKIWTLLDSCTPLSTTPLVLYPLVTLAALDLVEMSPTPALSAALILTHLVVWLVASRSSVLCDVDYRKLDLHAGD